jgi:hypothetical protein
MLIECKHAGGDLSLDHAGQLLRYLHVTEARIGVLTNGLVYRFYTDLDKSNKMDERPFLELDLLNIEESAVNELAKLSKGSFDLDEMMSSAHNLKYTRALKNYLASQFSSPNDDFVRFMTKQVYSGAFTAKVAEQFSDLVRRSMHQFVNDRVTGRLKTAMRDEEIHESSDTPSAEEAISRESGVETSEEEMEGFHIVRAILRAKVDVSRIAARDVKSYFGVLLDDNNRRPIIRLHLNSTSTKFITVFDIDGGERIDIESVDDIYNVADRLYAAVERYDAS